MVHLQADHVVKSLFFERMLQNEQMLLIIISEKHYKVTLDHNFIKVYKGTYITRKNSGRIYTRIILHGSCICYGCFVSQSFLCFPDTSVLS